MTQSTTESGAASRLGWGRLAWIAGGLAVVAAIASRRFTRLADGLTTKGAIMAFTRSLAKSLSWRATATATMVISPTPVTSQRRGSFSRTICNAIQ